MFDEVNRTGYISTRPISRSLANGAICTKRSTATAIWSTYLSETRDMAAAKAFLRSAKSVTQVEPEQGTTDGHTSYPSAIAEELGTDVERRTSQYKNNVIEQNHRSIEGRYQPMRGFKNFNAAYRFCRAFDEVRNFLRPISYINQSVSLAHRRTIHVQRVAALRELISVA